MNRAELSNFIKSGSIFLKTVILAIKTEIY